MNNMIDQNEKEVIYLHEHIEGLEGLINSLFTEIERLKKEAEWKSFKSMFLDILLLEQYRYQKN